MARPTRSDLPDPHLRKPDRIPAMYLRDGDVVLLRDGRSAVVTAASGPEGDEVRPQLGPGLLELKNVTVQRDQVSGVICRLKVGDYVIARGHKLGLLMRIGRICGVRHFENGRLQYVLKEYSRLDIELADPDAATRWRDLVAPTLDLEAGPELAVPAPLLNDPRLRRPEGIATGDMRRGDFVQLADGRTAVVLAVDFRHRVRVLPEIAPRRFTLTRGPAPESDGRGETLAAGQVVKVLHRIRVGDVVVSWQGKLGVVAKADLQRSQRNGYAVRHIDDGRWQPLGAKYALGEIALAEPEEAAAWVAAVGSDGGGDAPRPEARLRQTDLWSLVALDFEATPIPPLEARPGDIVLIGTETEPWILGALAKGQRKVRSAPARDVRRRSQTIRPDRVRTIVHRLGAGQFVLALGSPLKLGRIEEFGPDAGDEELVLRTLTDGRRWGEHAGRWSSDLIWPVAIARVEALLAARGIPPPPMVRTGPQSTPGGSHLAPSAAALPGVPITALASAPMELLRTPLPPGEFAALFTGVAFRGQFRRYQSMAIEAFEKARSSGRRSVYLVLPPGAGKTLVGLEIARRLGNRTIALGPNTAIQEQWVKQWGQYQPALVAAGDSADLRAPITALTYQSICNLDSHNPALEEQLAEWQDQADGAHPAEVVGNPHHEADAARLRGHARRLIAQAGDHEKLLALLHPNGRLLVERIKAAGQFTIVLDECHHLLEMWGYLLRALVHELGEKVFLVGLTATPPAEMDGRESVLYEELFGRADFEVATPAVVKEGNLAPYQELAYLTTPLDHENAYIAEEKTRFEELVTEMSRPDLGTMSFLDWLRVRVFDRTTRDGVQVTWSRFEADQPALALAALRYCSANQVAIPAGARLGEAQSRGPTADDWVTLIGDYCIGRLRESGDPRDLEAWEMIRRALPSLGYVLTRQGIRSYVSPVDRVLLLSASKGVAAIEILTAEQRALGADLRALLLCDYEVAGSDLVGKLRGVLDTQAGSAALLLKTLLSDAGTAALDPILVTGQTVACSRSAASAIIPWLGEQSPALGSRLAAANLFKPGTGDGDGWDAVVNIRPSSGAWSAREYLPLITRYFEEGRSRCLLGTRGLLGEGWDAKSINVLIDLTGVTTTTSVHQMRGRSLRLDPRLPRKVADNWDVVCVARDHPKGMADYERFVRKHRNYFGITTAGEIESGVGHVDPRLSAFGPPPDQIVGTINFEVLERSSRREMVHELWGVGKPYRNLPTQTVRIRSARPLGPPAQGLRGRSAAGSYPRLLKVRGAGGVLLGAAAVTVGFASGHDLPGLGAGLLIGWGGVGSAVASIRRHVGTLEPSGALEDLAAAVADALAATRLIDERLGSTAVRVVPQSDGYYRCYLEGAGLADSAAFATALDELMAPIQSPRYVIPRFVPSLPRTWADGLVLLARQFGNPRLGSVVVYHAIPSALGANRDRVRSFQAAWNVHVSQGEALYEDDPRAQAIIQLQRGEDPFAVTTQMRTLWV